MKKCKVIKWGLGATGLVLSLFIVLYYTPLLSKTPLSKLVDSPSKDTFTLQGEVPANFRLDIISYYQRDKADECLRYSSAAGRKISYQTGIKQTIETPNNESYQVTIPISYHASGCHLPIQSVKIIAFGYYGQDLKEKSMEQWAASLSFVDSAQLEDEAPHLTLNQPRVYQGSCRWSFRLMADNSLLKFLNCYSVNEKWEKSGQRGVHIYDILCHSTNNSF